MKFFTKVDPAFYVAKDKHLTQSLGVKDFLALGVGTIISTSIFTLPGTVAANYAGPSIIFSYLIAAFVAGMVAFAYSEMATVMPFAGSAYSWISVLFGEGWGWIAGWSLLAEYFVAVAFVGAGFSATFQAILQQQHILLPRNLRIPLVAYDSSNNLVRGGLVDVIALVIVVIAALIVWRGASDAGKVSQVLVVLKVIAILVFIGVGTYFIISHKTWSNYVPFIPQHKVGTSFGGFSGIWSGVSVIFLAYIGFDSIAANSGEAINPKKTMPRGILGSLLIAVFLFSMVTMVLVGMVPYVKFANQAAPVSFALTQVGFGGISLIVSLVADAGMFIALLGMILAGSRLLYSFGRDGMLPASLGKLNKKGHPTNAVILLTVITALVSAFLPFTFLSQLISAGTLIAFMFVSVAMFSLRKREGKTLPLPSYKVPFYPVLPVLGFVGCLFVFLGLQTDAKIYAGLWFLLGIAIYFAYGRSHSLSKTSDQINGVNSIITEESLAN